MEKKIDLLLQIYINSEKYMLYQQWPREKSLPRLPVLKTHTLTPTVRRFAFLKKRLIVPYFCITVKAVGCLAYENT